MPLGLPTGLLFASLYQARSAARGDPSCPPCGDFVLPPPRPPRLVSTLGLTIACAKAARSLNMYGVRLPTRRVLLVPAVRPFVALPLPPPALRRRRGELFLCGDDDDDGDWRSSSARRKATSADGRSQRRLARAVASSTLCCSRDTSASPSPSPSSELHPGSPRLGGAMRVDDTRSKASASEVWRTRLGLLPCMVVGDT